MPPYVGRFAPSPTGPLHFGSLIAAAASYADARHFGGSWLLRIEDLDPPREVPGATEAIIQTLQRYGFAWDGAIIRQSDRHAAYEAALARLAAIGGVFPCACTRKELEGAPIGVGGERVYPGHCRNGLAPGRSGRALRARVGDASISFVDLLQGPQHQQLATDVGDFVLRRADGFWAYQLAVVVDDAWQQINHVVRGSDLLASTPRQIWLQQQLGYPTPQYLQVPVAVNNDGEKLSKQTKAPALPDNDPLPWLRAAWRFLGQPDDGLDLTTPAAFWAGAIPRWDRRLLPPVPAAPLPPDLPKFA